MSGCTTRQLVANDILVDISQEPAARIRLDDQRAVRRDRPATSTSSEPCSLLAPWTRRCASSGTPNRADFVVPIGRLIAAERRAGRAPAGADPHALALMLLELNDRSLELFALGIGPARRKHVDAVVSIWLRSIYGSDPEPASGSSRKEKRR